VARSQIQELPRRVREGRANHDHLAAILNESSWFDVPQPLAPEERAPDSIQFNLLGVDADEDARAFQQYATDRGVSLEIFGLSGNNARAFWNWRFLGPQAALPQARAMLLRACDVRLPAGLTPKDLDFIAAALIEAADEAFSG
jgi:hypothetical protein